MKHLFLSLLIFMGFSGFSQVTVHFRPPSIVTACYGDNVKFQVDLTPDTGSYTFTWKRNNVIIPSPDTSGTQLRIKNVSYADSGYYTCLATSAFATGHSDTARLHISPRLYLDTLYRYNELGCPGSCKGQMRITVSGGNPPYIYDWGVGGIHMQGDSIAIGFCKGTYMLNVTDIDNTHCISREYTIEVLHLPKVIFTMDPEDTLYLTKPTLTVEFPDSSRHSMTNWEWRFGDGTSLANINPAQHIYTRTGRFIDSLNYTDLNGCDTTITDTITVKRADLFIPNVISPNGDGSNDCFIIQEKMDRTLDLEEIYLSVELVIVNRWGRKVYETSNYHCKKSGATRGCEGWDGGNLADGVYFYVLTCHGLYEDDVFRGSVTIVR